LIDLMVPVSWVLDLARIVDVMERQIAELRARVRPRPQDGHGELEAMEATSVA
jgi:hypothetical protein